MTVHRASDMRLALALMERRRAAVRRTRLPVMQRHERRLLRRWVGRRLVALGTRLAKDPTMRPAEAR